jgi:hypothetical protein
LLELRAELVFKADDLPIVLVFLTVLFLTLEDRVELGLPENWYAFVLTLELLVGVTAVEDAREPRDTSFNELDEILELRVLGEVEANLPDLVEGEEPFIASALTLLTLVELILPPLETVLLLALLLSELLMYMTLEA